MKDTGSLSEETDGEEVKDTARSRGKANVKKRGGGYLCSRNTN